MNSSKNLRNLQSDESPGYENNLGPQSDKERPLDTSVVKPVNLEAEQTESCGLDQPDKVKTDERILSRSDSINSKKILQSYSDVVTIKILLWQNVVGSIMGHDGQTILNLQVETETMIRLSQNKDFYPGTSERVCLVQGSLDKVKLAVKLIFELIKAFENKKQSQLLESESHSSVQFGNKEISHDNIPEFEQKRQSITVRILLPSQSCGMIIGKGGTNIKTLPDRSGVFSVQLSQTETTMPALACVPSSTASLVVTTNERILTIKGPNIVSCVSCINLILDEMAAHPEVSLYVNATTSYRRLPVGFTQLADAYQLSHPQVSPWTERGLVELPFSTISQSQVHELPMYYGKLLNMLINQQ